MIGIAMEKWPDDALRRVVDAPVERWWSASMATPAYDCARGWWDDRGGDVCLYGFATNYGEHWARTSDRLDGAHRDGPNHYDRLCKRFGLPRTVRAVKLRALAILLRRHPLDAKIAVLRAEVG